MGLVEDLNRISAMQGKAPIDPTIIHGDAPPPRHDPDIPAEWLDPEIDLDEPAPEFTAPPSPLIPRRSPAHTNPENPREAAREYQPPAGFDAPAFPETAGLTFNLCVADTLASWKQRSVTLTEGEEKAVRAIVLRAIRREVDADLGAVGEKPRRTRKPKPPVEASFAAGNQPARRKPGRPRKNETK